MGIRKFEIRSRPSNTPSRIGQRLLTELATSFAIALVGELVLQPYRAFLYRDFFVAKCLREDCTTRQEMRAMCNRWRNRTNRALCSPRPFLLRQVPNLDA